MTAEDNCYRTVKNAETESKALLRPRQQTQFYGMTRAVRYVYTVESLSARWCYLTAHNIHAVSWCPRGAA